MLILELFQATQFERTALTGDSLPLLPTWFFILKVSRGGVLFLPLVQCVWKFALG